MLGFVPIKMEFKKSIENEIQNSFTKWKRNSPLFPPPP
jgi:hypothetical protein